MRTVHQVKGGMRVGISIYVGGRKHLTLLETLVNTMVFESKMVHTDFIVKIMEGI